MSMRITQSVSNAIASANALIENRLLEWLESVNIAGDLPWYSTSEIDQYQDIHRRVAEFSATLSTYRVMETSTRLVDALQEFGDDEVQASYTLMRVDVTLGTDTSPNEAVVAFYFEKPDRGEFQSYPKFGNMEPCYARFVMCLKHPDESFAGKEIIGVESCLDDDITNE